MSKPNLDFSPDYGKKVRLLRVGMGLNQSQFAQLMGFTKNTVGKVEMGGDASERFKQQIEMLEQNEAAGKVGQKSSFGQSRDLPVGDEIIRLRQIPLVNLAVMGPALEFEEIPASWQQFVPTDVQDKDAYAIRLVGDSGEPRYQEGDIATLTPSAHLRQNQTVVASIEDQGFVFKIYSRQGDTCTFTSYNPMYRPFEVPIEKVNKIVPVYSVLKIVNKQSIP